MKAGVILSEGSPQCVLNAKIEEQLQGSFAALRMTGWAVGLPVSATSYCFAASPRDLDGLGSAQLY
jgi:hypothetical protein